MPGVPAVQRRFGSRPSAPARPRSASDPAASPFAYDARYVTSAACGIGQMCLGLLRGLADLGPGFALKVLVNRHTELPADLLGCGNLAFVEADWDPRSLGNQLRLPGLLRRLGVRLLHGADVFNPLGAGGVAQVVTLHDVIPLVCRKELAQSRKGRLLPLWKGWLRLQCARAARVVTVSRHSAADIIRELGVDPRKVRVVYNPVREWRTVEPAECIRRRLGLRGRVLTYVGRQDPYKNVVALVRALPLVRQALAGEQIDLVVAGLPNDRYPAGPQEARRLGLEGHVHFPGYLPEASLGALYRASDVFVFPSLYEGFGMPPVEAMRFGVPVVAGDRSALPEVLGDAALFVDVADPRAIAAGVLRVLGNPDLARRLRLAGPARAARFSARAAAVRYRRVYDEVLRQAV